MKLISPRNHGYLDYLTSIVFLLAPALLKLSGLPAALSYGLAAVHCGLTLLTAFPLGLFRAVPLKLHGMIEGLVALTLGMVPWIFQRHFARPARIFYTAMGAAIFLVWLCSDYSPVDGTSS